MKNLIVKWLILTIFSIIFIGCGNPKIDTSTFGKYKESIEEVRNSLPLDKLNDFNMAILVYNNFPSEINGKTGLEIIAYHQSKLKELELKQQELAKKEADEITTKKEEIEKTIIFSYDDNFILKFNITDSRGKPKKLQLGLSIKTNEKDIKLLYENNKALVIDKITELIESRSSEELLTVGGKNLLKDEMNEAIAYVLNDNKENKEQIIVRTFFTTFIID